MTISIGWPDILLRLGLAFAAGFLLGLERNESGHVAGLRTLLLVCLAAAVSMIQVNLLLGIAGKQADSFVVLDLMRLPLGILSGMGFIGAGAILRRGNLVVGVTTAATLWFATVIGLCFGGGQLGLGTVSLALAFVILWLLRILEQALPRHRTGRLVLVSGSDELEETMLRKELNDGRRSRLVACAFTQEKSGNLRQYSCVVRWRSTVADSFIPDFVNRLANHPAVKRIEWSPEAFSDHR